MAAPSPDQIRGALLSGFSWSSPQITYSIPRAGSIWTGYGPGTEPFVTGYDVLDEAQAQAFREVVASVGRVIATPIVERDDVTATGDIRIAFSPDTGHAYYPIAGQAVSGDIWLDLFGDDVWSGGATYAWGSSGPRQIALHELGHALGLKHPHEGEQTLPAEYGSVRYSMMSYNTAIDGIYYTFRYSDENSDGFTRDLSFAVVNGPMVDDILALQSLYGANKNTGSGDDVYRWQPGKAFFETIWDAGGHDVVDLSDHERPSIVDLTPGAYSSIGYFTIQQQIDYWGALFPDQAERIARSYGFESVDGRVPIYTWTDNLGIAYGAVIEDVRAGGGDDTLTGNAAANVLVGNAGTDAIFGGDGDDTLDGGAGYDLIRGGSGNDLLVGGVWFDNLQGNTGEDTVQGGSSIDWVLGGQGNDLVSGDEGDDIANGNLGDDTVSGGEGADTVRGGQGNDLLTGGDGDDFLSGDRGSDTITGGAGADRFIVFVGSGLDRITDFNRAEGDQVELQGAEAYTLAQEDADVRLTLASGDQLVLASVDLARLAPGWLVLT